MAWGTFSIADATYDNKSLNTGDDKGYTACYNNDGTKLFTGERDSGYTYIRQYSLSTAYDISTASYVTRGISLSGGGIPLQVYFKPDGTKVYISPGSVSGYTYQYNLSTAWDISTASYVGYSNIGGYRFYIRDNGTDVYKTMLVSSSYRVYQYSMSTAWDITTLSATPNTYYQLGSSSFEINGLYFKDDGTKMYVVSNNTNTVRQYTLSTAWDISTASYDGLSVSISSQTTTPYGLSFRHDNGSKFLVSAYNYIYQYSTYTPTPETNIKSYNGLAKASIKSINGLAIASVKSINGLS